MVRTTAFAGTAVVRHSAAVAGDRVLLEHRVFRIHFSGAGQPDRVSGERGAVHAFPIESDSGSHFTVGLYGFRPHFFQNGDVPVEPFDGFCVHGDGGLFYF